MHEQSSQHWLAEKIPSLASAIRFSGCLLGLAEINIPDGESASFVSKLQRIRDLQDEFIDLAEERGLTLAVSSSKNAKSWGSRASQELQTGYLTHRSQQSWSFAGTPVKSGITESTQLKSQSNFTTSSNIAVEELEHLKTVSREFSRLVDEWSHKAKSYVSHQSVLVKGFDTNPPPAKNSTPTPADLKSLGTSLDVKTLSPVVSYNYSDTPSKQGGVSPELTMRNGENSANKLGHKPVVSDVTSASKRYGSRVVKLAENDYTVCDTPREGTIDLIEDNQPIFTGELTNSPSKYYKVVRPHKNEVEYIQPRYRHDNPNYKETVKMTVQLEPKSSEKTKKTSDPSKAEPAPPSAFQIEEQPLFGSEESDINRVLFKTRDDVKDVILQIHDDSLVRDTWSHIKSNKELTPSGNDTDANTRGWTDEGRVYEKELDPAHLVNWLDPKSPDKPLFSDERSPNKCPSPPALELTPLKPQLRAGDLGTITEQEEEGTRRSDPTEPPETDVRNSIIPPPSVVQDTEKAEPQIAVKERTSLLSSMSEAGPISSLKPAGLPAITFDVDVPYLISVNQLPTSVTEMSVTHVYDDTQQEEICSVDYSHSSGVLMIATSVSLRCWKTDQQGKWVLQATKTLEKNEFGYRVKLLSGGMDCLFSGWGELHVYVLRTSDLETLSKTSIGRLKSPRNPQIANAHKEPAYNVWSNPWESYAFPHFSHTGDLNIYHVYDDTKVKIEGFWAVDEQVSSHICLDSYDGSHNFIGVGKLKEEYTLHLAVLKQPNVEVLKEKQAISASIAAEHFQEYSTSSMLLSSLDGIPPIKSVLSMCLLSQPITTEENELKVALLIKKPDDTYCLCLVSFLTSLNGNPKVWVSSGHPLGDTIQTEPTLRTITDTVRLFKVPNVDRVMVQSGNRLAEWTLSETSTELSLTTSSQILNDTKVVSEKEYPFLQNGQLITLQLRTLGSDSPGIGLWLGAIPLYKNTAPDAIEERTAEELVSFTKMFTPDPKEAQRCSQLPEPMVWLESQHGGRNIFYQSEEYNAYLHTAGSDNEAFHTKSGQKPAIPLCKIDIDLRYQVQAITRSW